MPSLNLHCPYCGKNLQVEPPRGDEYQKPPSEVACLPYTRDIGRFDPKPEDDIFSPELWSRIGKTICPSSVMKR